jgi:SAM-dependent methyltransferase
MKMVERIIARSGELCFDDDVDVAVHEDQPRYRWLTEALRTADAGDRFIDFGCWTGKTLETMAKLGYSRLAGVDIPGKWIDVAKQELPDAEFHAIPSFESLPQSLAEGFDVATFLETIEHIERGTEERVLKNIAGTLRPGGLLVLSTPVANLTAPLDPAWFLVGHRHYRTSTLRNLLQTAGFDNIEIRYSGNFTTAFDVISLYTKKHILHKQHVPSDRAMQKMDTGLQKSWSLGAMSVWAFATKR